MVLAGALRWSSTAVTGGRVMAVGRRWGVGGRVRSAQVVWFSLFWRWSGWVCGLLVIGWLRCCDGWVFLFGGYYSTDLGCFLVRFWGIFGLGGVGGVGIGSYATGENL